MGEQYLLYSTIYRYALFSLSSMHCVKGITTFPNRHMKEGKCSVMTGTGLCKPWMPLKIKVMEKSQATATWDLDTRDDQKDYLFFWGGMGLIFLLAGDWVVGRRGSGMGYLGN